MPARRIILPACLAAGLMVAAAAPAQAEIIIGAAGPLTGQYASFGQQLKAGAEMAVKHINEAGGVLGQELVLELGDDACDPKQAVALANQFVNKGVIFVAGHFCSGSSIPASDVYNEEGILQISPGSTNPQLTDRGLDNVFRVCGRDDQQGRVDGDYLARHVPGGRIAILHDKSTYGKGLADEVKKALNEQGITEILYDSYTTGERDFSALVSKLKVNNADAVFIGGYHAEVGLITRQAREQGLNATIMSGDALVTLEFWSITGEAGEGTLFTFSPDPRKNPEARVIVEKFRAAGVEPEGYVLYTYGAIQAFAQAAERAGSLEPEALFSALHEGEFDTVLGRIGFDEKGDVTAAGYVVYRWSNGNYDYAE